MAQTDTIVFSENETKEIGRNLLRSGFSIRLQLAGNSMFPFLLCDDVAVIVPKPISELKIGQIIVFENGDKWIAHRLIRMYKKHKNLQLQTQGDSVAKADAPFGEKDYLGTINTIFSHDAKRKLDSPFSQFRAKLMVNLRPFPQFFFRIILKIRNKVCSPATSPH